MKNYNILTLGASGAGKTVFMASMFKSLSTQGEHGFYLEAEDFKKQKLLNNIYTNLIIRKWPETTRRSEISEWKFTCVIKSLKNGHNFPICQFTYFDYAGGRFTEMDEEDSDLQETILQADAILGLLDGQKIQALMSNKNEQKIDDFLKRDLPPIIKWMSYSQAPIQFVISKWDLLENDNFGLKEISDRLLKIPEFKELVVNRNEEGSPVRLIPVSSVGSGFVTPQPDGGMEIIGNSIPRPFHMEVPVSCVMPDLFEKEHNRNLKRLTAIRGTNIGEGNRFYKFLKHILNFSFAIDILVDFLVSMFLEESDNFTQEVVKKIDDLLLEKLRKIIEKDKRKIDKIREKRDKLIEKIEDKTTALKSAVASFLYISNKLSQDFPNSEIRVDKLKK